MRRREPPDEGGFYEDRSGISQKVFSFKDVVMNGNSGVSEGVEEWDVEDLALIEKDVRKEVSDGVPSIDFSNRVYDLIEKSMTKTLIVKLLSRSIGYNALWNKIYALWKPKMRFQLMDIDNGYFLAKFEPEMDYSSVVAQGPWVVFGHYLTVQPWSPDFSTMHTYSQSVVAWIHIPGLSGALYKRSLLMEIGSLVGKVVKIDLQLIRGREGNLLGLMFK